MYTKIMLITAVVILTSSCTEFAMLSSTAGIAASQNAYAKAYSGIDFLTIIKTEKDIKTHIYHSLKKDHPGASLPSGYPPSGCVSERERPNEHQ